MTTTYCMRCGKAKHQGKCTFTKDKKSVVETLTGDMKTLNDKVK